MANKIPIITTVRDRVRNKLKLNNKFYVPEVYLTAQ